MSDCQQEFEHLPQMLPVLKNTAMCNGIWSTAPTVQTKHLPAPAATPRNTAWVCRRCTIPQLKFRYTLGINFIPTTILLNPQGEVELMIPRILKSASEVRALLDYAVNAAANATADYVKKNLSFPTAQ